MTAPQDEVPDMFAVPVGLPRPAEATAGRRQRLETYFAALAAASTDPTRRTLRAAAWAAMDLHTSYDFIGSCCHGIVCDPRGVVLLRQATLLMTAATQSTA